MAEFAALSRGRSPPLAAPSSGAGRPGRKALAFSLSSGVTTATRDGCADLGDGPGASS